MKNLSLFTLALVLILSLASCGGNNTTPSGGTDTQSVTTAISDTQGADDDTTQSSSVTADYSGAYESFASITEAMAFVTDMIDANNSKLESENPDGYFSDPSYTYMLWIPFMSIDLAYTAGFNEVDSDESLGIAFAMLISGAKYTHIGKNSYSIEFTVTDSEPYDVKMTAEYDSSTGAFRYIGSSNESGNWETTSFTEFVPLGNDTYALYDMDEQAIVTFKDGVITEMYYSSNKSYSDYNDSANDIAIINENAIYPAGKGCSESWVTSNRDDLSQIVTYKDGVLTIESQEAQSVYDDNYNATGIEWAWKDAIVIAG